MRRFFRRLVPYVVGLWSVFLLLAAAGPCTAAVSATHAHDHVPWTRLVVPHVVGAGHGPDGRGVSGCCIYLPDFRPFLTQITAGARALPLLPQGHLKVADAAPEWNFDRHLPIPASPVRRVASLSPPVYLLTLRLRE